MKKNLLTFMIAAASAISYLNAANKALEVNSPDNSIKVTVQVDNGITYAMSVDGKTVIQPSPVDLELTTSDKSSSVSASKAKIKKVTEGTKSETIVSPLYRVPSFDVTYNFSQIKLNNGLMIEFRVFNDGMAYRYETTGFDGRDYTVNKEVSDFHFAGDYQSYIPYSTNPKKPEAMAFQATYSVASLSKQPSDNLGFLPLTVCCGDNSTPDLKLTLMESDLESYPGMFVRPSGHTLQGWFSSYPKSFDYYEWRVQKYVTSTESYIAKCRGNRTFPWRIIAASRKDTQMPVNHLVYALASPSRIADTSWIKPGLVAWDWWNDWGITGVDFQAGINMDTYKYYIDFASAYGLDYIILDEGWYNPKSGDMLTTIDAIDLPELVRYGKSKNVRIILWTVFNVLDKDLEAACRKYADMGIAGFKVDFLDRDDQEGVDMIYRIADACARHHLMLDYHGIYKPTGINRTYPNIVNFESVFGMEEAKWTKHDEKDMPQYDVTFPFIRMQCGFVDFTPGGMRNATAKDFQPIYYNPLTMGTRCHQLAMYVIHDSPLTMLADNPTAYMAEPEYTKFIAGIPTVFDETRILDGKMGEYIVTARRKGSTWYIGGQTNWTGRDLTVDLSQLGLKEGAKAIVYRDGVNAERNGCDYKTEIRNVSGSDKITIHLASGGGFVIKFEV